MRFLGKSRLVGSGRITVLPDPALRDTSEQQQQFFENLSDKWLTTTEAAEYLRISLKCLQNLSSNGKIPHYKFGRRNRYLLSELKKLLLAQPRGGFYGN